MGCSGAETWRWPSLDEAADSADEFRPTSAGGPRPASSDAEREDAEQLREQRRRAEELIEEARDQADQIRCEAREEARTEAVSEARTRLEEALTASLEEQTEAFERARELLLEQIEAAATERMEQIEEELAELIATMAGKVVRRTVEADDGVVLDVVRATIEQAAGAESFTIRVSAPEEQLVREAMAELVATTDGAGELEVVADEAIGPGGCIVETERGRFDARIETQLEMLGDEIERVRGGGGSE